MKKIKTESNDLIILKIPDNAKNFQFGLYPPCLWYDSEFGQITRFDIPKKDNYKILGKLSELTDKQCSKFIKKFSNFSYKNYIKDVDNVYIHYKPNHNFPKNSFISLLQFNGIDTKFEYLIIEII